jgi:hypothetical protein
MAAGIPIQPVGLAGLVSRSVTIPGLGLSVQLNTWGSTKTRTQWASFDVMFGASYGGDANAGFIIRSAAE